MTTKIVAAVLGVIAVVVAVAMSGGSTFGVIETKTMECPEYVAPVDASIASQIAECQGLYDCPAEDAGPCEDAGDCSLDAADYDAYGRAVTPAAAITGTSGYRTVCINNNTAAHVYLTGSASSTSIDGGWGPICRGTGCNLGAECIDVYQGHLWCLAASASTDGGTGIPISVKMGN